MGNTRQWTRQFNARVSELQSALKANGIRSEKKRRELISRAASGRPADLREQAKVSLALRRIAGTPSLFRRASMQEGK